MFQSHDDYLDCIKGSQMTKEQFQDIVNCLETIPYYIRYYIIDEQDHRKAENFRDLYLKKNKSESEIDYMIDALNEETNLELTRLYNQHLLNFGILRLEELAKEVGKSPQDNVFFNKLIDLIEFIIHRMT